MMTTWTKEKPKATGYYFTRGLDLFPTVVHMNEEGEFLTMGARTARHDDYFDSEGREWAGPIPEPTNMTGTELSMMLRDLDQKAKAARHARIRDLAERMAIAAFPQMNMMLIGTEQIEGIARVTYSQASAVVAECERRARGE